MRLPFFRLSFIFMFILPLHADDGDLDASFGTHSGYVTFHHNAGASSVSSIMNAIGLQSNGNIVGGGYYNHDSKVFHLCILDTNGSEL